jgi:hypothetical protein
VRLIDDKMKLLKNEKKLGKTLHAFLNLVKKILLLREDLEENRVFSH